MSDSIQLGALVEELQRARRCAVRLALDRRNESWVVMHMDVRNGSGVPSARYRRIVYPNHAFLAGKSDGSQIAEWLADMSGSFNGELFNFPALNGSVMATRRRSRERWGLVVLSQPHIDYEVAGDRGNPNIESVGPIVAPRRPHFPSWKAACLALIFDEWNTFATNVSLPGTICGIRLALNGPWLDSVHFGTSSLRVVIAGRRLRGCRLQIVSPDGPLDDIALTTTRRSLETMVSTYRDGQYRVVLYRANSVLDSRELLVRGGRPSLMLDDGVTVDPPPLTDHLRSLIQGGEGPSVEFKLAVDRDLKRADRSVAAFANTLGGTLLIGVGDDRSVVGVPSETVSARKDDLVSRLRQALRPFPTLDVQDAQIDGAHVIAVFVSPTESPPVAVGKPPTYYIRRGANNYQATPEEVGDLVRQRAHVAGVTAGLFTQADGGVGLAGPHARPRRT